MKIILSKEEILAMIKAGFRENGIDVGDGQIEIDLGDAVLPFDVVQGIILDTAAK